MPVELLALGLTLALAAEEPAQADDEAPPVELLEFLGAWMTDDGAWIDPFSLPDPDAPEGEPSDGKPMEDAGDGTPDAPHGEDGQ